MSIRKRPHTIGTRVTFVERKLVREAAESMGLRVSDFIRQAVMEKAASAKAAPFGKVEFGSRLGHEGIASQGKAGFVR